MEPTAGLPSMQLCCIASITAQPMNNGRSVSVTATLTCQGGPTRTMNLDVPANSDAADIVGFITSHHFQSGSPINEAEGMISHMGEVVNQFASARNIPTHVSVIRSIRAELTTSRNMLQQAKDGLTHDILSGNFTVGEPSPTRVQKMEQAEAAARRGQAQIHTILRTLEIGSTITKAQHDRWTRAATFDWFKISVIVEGFKKQMFL